MPAPAHLIDSNILLRIARRGDPDHVIVDAALAKLLGDGAVITHCRTSPNSGALPRGRQIATASGCRRPTRRLVLAHAVSGVQVHDARLAAAMRVYGVTHIPTLNPGDFERYSDIAAVHPSSLAHAG